MASGWNVHSSIICWCTYCIDLLSNFRANMSNVCLLMCSANQIKFINDLNEIMIDSIVPESSLTQAM